MLSNTPEISQVAIIMEGSPADSCSVQTWLSHMWAHQWVVRLSPANNLSTGQRSCIDSFWDFFNFPSFLLLLPIKTLCRFSVCHHLIKDEYWVWLSVSIFLNCISLFENFDVWVLIIHELFVSENGSCSSLLDLVLFLINFFFPSLNLLWFV